MFDNLDFSKMGAMFKEAQKHAKEMEAEAANKEFTAKSGGGMVKVTMNGKGEVIDIHIDASLLEDKESLQILLISSINDASAMVEENKKLAATQMLSRLGGFGHQN
ncbi:MAG: YbaB/EbfC family nucleoid-associated protein [Campylobacterales bacterium]|nr:YbaB/EbfC family nucleoid-associated protein [Campylobacterales bacterium]